MAACHDEADRFMAAFQSALKKDGVPERALADRLFTLAHRMLSATVEVDPSVLKDDEELRRQHRAQRAALEQLQRAFKTSADAGLARDARTRGLLSDATHGLNALAADASEADDADAETAAALAAVSDHAAVDQLLE